MSRIHVAIVVAFSLIPDSMSAGTTPPANPASLKVPGTELARAQNLVKQLASPAYPERAAASRELRAMGRLALEVISIAAESHPDPEVRFRCQRLLPAAITADFEARIAAFIADIDGRYDHQLPGWEQFRAIVGSDREARLLFTQLVKSEANREILAGIGHSETELASRLTDRLNDLHSQMYPRFVPPGGKRYTPTVEDAVTVVFTETLLADKGRPAGRINSYSLVTHSAFRSAFTSSAQRELLKKLLVQWLDSRTDTTGIIQAMSVASSLQLSEAPRYIARVLATDTVPMATRASAATTLARLGGKEHIAKLTPLFKDESVVRRNPNQEDIQLRDVALAMAMVLAEKDPTELGLIAQSTVASRKYYYWNYRFANDEARKTAFARWEAIKPTLLKE